MAEGLKINVSADVSQAVGGVKQLISSLGTIAPAASGSVDAISKLENRLNQLKLALGAAKSPGYNLTPDKQTIAGVEAQIVSLTAKIRGLKAEEAAFKTFTAEITAFGGGVKNTNPAALAFANSVRQIGFESKAAIPATAAAGTAVKEFASQSVSGFGAILGGARGAFSVIRQLAYILPGIGIAGIFNLIGEGLINIISKTNELTDAQKEQKKLQDDITGKTAEESARVEVLVKALQSGTLSRQQTKGAIEELKRIAPDYFGLLDKEKASVNDITTAYNSYNNALVRTIENQIKQAALTELIKKRLDIQQQFKEADAFIKSAIANGESLDQLSKRLITEDTEKSIRATVSATDALSSSIRITNKDVQARVDAERKANQTTTERIAGVKSLVAALLAEQNALSGISTADIKIPERELKKVKEEKILIRAEIRLPENEADLLRRGFTKIDLAKIFQKGLKDVPRIVFSVDTQKGIEALDGLREAMERTKIASKDFVQVVNAAFANLATQGLSQIGDTIGAALSGSQDAVSAALKGFASLFGDFIQTIGKALIQYGIVKSGLDKVLKGGIAIPGLVAIGLGVAAVALGALVKNSYKQKAFAEGGIVTGPTNALIGEAGPEVVFPLAKLKSFLGGMQSNNGMQLSIQQVDSRISGGDIYQAWQLAQVRRGRGIR